MARNKTVGVIGASSMVGSRFCELSSLNLVKTDPNGAIATDITDSQSVADFFDNYNFESVILFSAFTDVDAAEKQRDQKDSLSWQINVVGLKNIIDACRKFKRKLVFLSSDFVFDGTEGPYSEQDDVGGNLSKVSWYGITKIEGEREINKSLDDFIIIRISYPYRARFEQKDDFARLILKRYESGDLYPLFTDQQITPTFVDDVSRCIDLLLSQKANGTFHLASPIPVSPYEFGCELIKVFGHDWTIVKKGKLQPILNKPGIVPRPLKGGMKTTKIEGLGLTPTNWKQGINKIFNQSHGQLI